MSVSINFHRIKEMTSVEYKGIAWLNVCDDKGNRIALHMPIDMAQAIADAFNATFHKEPAE